MNRWETPVKDLLRQDNRWETLAGGDPPARRTGSEGSIKSRPTRDSKCGEFARMPTWRNPTGLRRVEVGGACWTLERPGPVCRG